MSGFFTLHQRSFLIVVLVIHWPRPPFALAVNTVGTFRLPSVRAMRGFIVTSSYAGTCGKLSRLLTGSDFSVPSSKFRKWPCIR